MVRENVGVTELNGSTQSVREGSLLPLLYADDQSSGWGEGMRAVTYALLEDVTLPAGAVVEVGCGGGQLLMELQQRYPERLVIGADLHPLALAHAYSFMHPSLDLTQASLLQLPLAENQVALLAAMDVFDQQGVELDAALAEGYRLLRPGGALVMRVSAHPSLYGPHDLAFHTGQRYTSEQLRDALQKAGFVVQRLTYANAALSLPVAAMRLAQRWGLLPFNVAPYQQADFHQMARWLLCQEAAWLYHADLPWGLSLCVVARKP